MAPHLTPLEIDFIQQQSALGKTPIQVHGLLAARRKRRNVAAPHLTKVRLTLKGKTYCRGLKDFLDPCSPLVPSWQVQTEPLA